MGNDTVIIPIGALEPPHNDPQALDAAAQAVGYTLMDYNDGYRLYHMETPDCFGTISHYRGIGIGTGASQISLGFPTVEETEDPNLDHYTYEQLSAYDVVYLCNFTYDDRATAEELVRQLSRNGTRVVIIASGIPEDRNVGLPAFLDLTCSTVNFYGGYPPLTVLGQTLECDLFPSGYADWKTVYVNGLDEVWGAITGWGGQGEQNQDLPFLGTAGDPNIVVLGLSLDYHYALTRDPTVAWILSQALGLEPGELPERELVPLGFTYRDNVITITSGYDGVNTTLTWHQEAFAPDRPIRQVNNLVEVDAGVTTIRLRYPLLWPSLAAEVAGVVLTAVFLLRVGRQRKKEAAAAAQQETPSQEEKSNDD